MDVGILAVTILAVIIAIALRVAADAAQPKGTIFAGDELVAIAFLPVRHMIR
jgi:hypothetical protein